MRRNCSRRRIEAEIIRPIYDEVVAEIGVEKAREILTRAIEKAAIGLLDAR